MIEAAAICPIDLARLQAKPERFWDKVAIRGTDDCWLWQATKGERYGLFGMRHQRHRAHRVAFALTKGPIPFGQIICHSCDVPLCVNPSHLVVGTQAENMADMARKGRKLGLRGEASPKAKLKAQDIVAIREAAKVASYREVGRAFGLHHGTVSDIVQGNTWAHVDPADAGEVDDGFPGTMPASPG